MVRKFYRFLSALLLVSILLAGQTPPPAYAASFVVNTLSDNTTDDAFCTLREAILAANNDGSYNGNCGPASNGNDTITFSVGGTIALGSTLPAIVSGEGALTIDGGSIIISGNNSVGVMIVNSGVTLTLNNLTIANGTGADCGGFNCGGGIYNSGLLLITNSTFSGNSAGDGGGIYNVGMLAVTNSTFSGNSAGGNGGGIFNNFGSLTITNSTFSGNSAVNGGGIFNNGALNYTNTIIANSASGGDCLNLLSGGGTIGTNTNNLVEDGSCSAALSGDPKLGPLQNNGGSTQTFALLWGSPAVDAGANGSCPATDQRGLPRPADGDEDGTATCDIGAFELQPSNPPTVSNVTAPGVGLLLQGQTLAAGPAQFTVTFNQDVTTTSAENTANYLLVRAGGNGVQTLDCAGGVSGGDTSISIDSAVYNSATRTAMLGVNGGQPLPAGLYRLFVCGTTSIVNANGDELYAGLTDYGLVFLVSTQTSGSGGGTGGTGTGDGSSETSTGALQLPDTGFTPDRVTALPPQPLEKTYSPTDLTLEIPSLKVKSNIVGVLKSGDGWDVTWLGNSVGWLEGSAFPTWKGNTVLTAHVWNADNTPGVFAEIKDLKYGERFYVHAFGQTYVYEVRENARLWGSNRVDKAFKSEEYDWVTLLTCEGYNPLTGEYLFRRIVRAVLVEVK